MLTNATGIESKESSIHRRIFLLILFLSALLLLFGVWWGWPTTFDQHDPTKRAIKMLWHRTLDPGVRYWGSFGYQEVLLLSVIPITAIKKLFALDQSFAEALMFLMTRILWAIKAVGIIVMSYWMSKELFQDRRAALLTMVMLSLSPGFIAWSHIPQVDLVHCFWYTFSAALTAFAWRRNNPRFLWYAAIAAGLAAGTKYVGGIIVLAPMATSFLMLRFNQALFRAMLLGALALLVFFITTPLVSGDPISWLPEYTADVLSNNSRDTFRPLAIWTLPGTIWNMIGPGVSILGIVGFILFVFRRSVHGSKAAWMLLLLSIIPYYLIFTGQHVATVRYMIPISATLLVAIGFLVSRLLDASRLHSLVITAITLAFLGQAGLVLALTSGFAFDTRVELAQWMKQNTNESDRIETLLNHRPYFTGTRNFIELARPHFQAESYQMHRDRANDKTSSIRKLHEFALRTANLHETELVTWIDKEREWLKKESKTFDTSINGPSARGEKYVILNLNTAEHYVLDWPGADPYSPDEKSFFLALINGEAPFKLKASFDPLVPEWLRYPQELWINVSPPIRVYEVL